MSDFMSDTVKRIERVTMPANFLDTDEQAGPLHVVNPLRSMEVAVPRCLWTAGAFVLWWKGETVQKPVSKDMLGHFRNLEHSDDEKICAFAGRYGPLGLCLHGKPATHEIDQFGKAGCFPVPASPDFPVDMARRVQGGYRTDVELTSQDMLEYGGICKEPLSAWRHYARVISAVLRIGSALKAGKAPNIQDWAFSYLGSDLDPSLGFASDKAFQVAPEAIGRESIARSREGDLSEFGYLVNGLLSVAGSRIALGWSSASGPFKRSFVPVLTFPSTPCIGLKGPFDSSSSLFGAIVSLVISEVSALSEHWHRCEQCDAPFEREVLPKRGAPVLCDFHQKEWRRCQKRKSYYKKKAEALPSKPSCSHRTTPMNTPTTVD